jgi:DnaJ-class molecular chaperone
MSDNFNPYNVLGLNSNASGDDIKKAYKRLALLYHPDKNNGNDLMFKRINEAYQILNDPVKKELYDTKHEMDNVDITFLTKFLSLMMTLLQEKMQQKMHEEQNIKKQKYRDKDRNTKKDEEKDKEKVNIIKKTKSIILTINVDLQDVYNKSIKKVMVRVKRRNTNKEVYELEYKSIPIYISLLNYEKTYIFEGSGDDPEHYDNSITRGDIIVNVSIISNILPTATIDTIISKYDIHIEQQITLYEYYFGVDREIIYFNDEILKIRHNVKINGQSSYTYYNSVHEIKGKGLPYEIEDENGNIIEKQGDLVIFFKLVLPSLNMSELEECRNIFHTYFNSKAENGNA